MMKRKRMLPGFAAALVAACAMGCPVATAQAATQNHAAVVPGVSAEVMRSYEAVKANILKSAEKMPADAYGYKPDPQVRTFARVLNHVSEAQMRVCGTLNGTAQESLAKVPEETAGKDAVIAALKASFAECDKAYGGASDATMAETLPAFNTRRSRIGLLWGNVSHDSEQYATLALYLRLKGLAPPSAEK